MQMKSVVSWRRWASGLTTKQKRGILAPTPVAAAEEEDMAAEVEAAGVTA
eukprot:COSAG02_NODE_16568_length_1073_cov_21.632444_2_plen_49_part_01